MNTAPLVSLAKDLIEHRSKVLYPAALEEEMEALPSDQRAFVEGFLAGVPFGERRLGLALATGRTYLDVVMGGKDDA